MTILSIVNDILDISKIESGKFEIFTAQYDTPSLINDIVTLNIVRIGEKPVTFKLTVPEDFPATLLGDDLRVKQIFNNLLSNAFKYTNEGKVEWRIDHEREGDDIWIVSTVEDTGIGMTAEGLKKLFSEYNQVDARTNRRVEGTGLGLAITKRLVRMMDGTIAAESEHGKGSKFTVRLKQRHSAGRPIGRAVAENLMGLRYTFTRRDRGAKLAKVDLSYAHVLVVDDISTNLDVVKGIMKPYKLKIDCASSGAQAITMLRAGSPRYSAVFMDHMMPEMDGIEAARIIREEIGTDYAKNVPIIALTANAIVGNEEMFLSRGFQAFLSKPIDMAKLDAILRRWVRDKAKETEPGPEPVASADSASVSRLKGIEIEGVNIGKALGRFSGDEAVFIDVLRSYSAGTRGLLAKLDEYLAAERLADYAIAVHGIKGSSYSIFAQEAGTMAEALETAAKAEAFATVRNGHGAFKERALALLQGIDAALGKIADERPTARAPDPALLRELQEACSAFDMDSADSAMERLEAYSYESGGELVAWLREKINDMAFEEIAAAKLSPGAARILVVDDNATNLKVAQALLSPILTDAAESGAKALALAKANRYDLILMDHMMPGMDGAEATRRLRAAGSEVPVIGLTAGEELGTWELLRQAGMNDVMLKPIDAEEMEEKLRRWLPQKLPEIEGIDSGEGVRNSGSYDMFVRLLGSFYKLIDLKSEKMAESLAAGRLGEITLDAHGLKNTARLIGAAALSESFGRIEQLGREGNAPALETEVPATLALYRGYKPRLTRFGEVAEKDKSPATNAELVSLLKSLAAQIDRFETDGAVATMAKLERLRVPARCAAQMKTLTAYMADMAMQKVMDTAAAMAETIGNTHGEETSS
jgi:CheY-like chemotaxis protein/anti-sigma regulatory factor (Ser/Thr protein kinase)